jgi:hypothetical protein
MKVEVQFSIELWAKDKVVALAKSVWMPPPCIDVKINVDDGLPLEIKSIVYNPTTDLYEAFLGVQRDHRPLAKAKAAWERDGWQVMPEEFT